MSEEKRDIDYPIPGTLRRFIITIMYLFLFGFVLYVPSYFLDEIFGDEKTLNVCAFTETFCPEALSRFEQLTGAKVNMTYVELDEQIYAKFKISDGEGYDIINVSDFMAQILAKQGMLTKLDKAKIKNKANINQHLLGYSYDPENSFSLPHKWFMYGIVYDKTFFKRSPDQMGLDFIFTDPESLLTQKLVDKSYKICMIDSPLDAFFLASLFKKTPIKDDEADRLCPFLIAQKQWIESYTLYSIEYFLFTNIVPIALTSSNFMRKIWDEDKRFDFAVPSEGGILVIENLVIPQKSKRVDLAHAFIDFMLSDEIAELNSSTYKWSSSNKKANEALDAEYAQLEHLFLSDILVQRLHIPLFDVTERKKINESWLHVGFA